MGKNLEDLNPHSTTKITKGSKALEVGAFYLKKLLTQPVCDTAITSLDQSLGQIESYAYVEIFLHFIFYYLKEIKFKYILIILSPPYL